SLSKCVIEGSGDVLQLRRPLRSYAGGVCHQLADRNQNTCRLCLPLDLDSRELRQELGQWIVQSELSVVHQNQRSKDRDRFAYRANVEDGVCAHWPLCIEVRVSGSFECQHLISLNYHHYGAYGQSVAHTEVHLCPD